MDKRRRFTDEMIEFIKRNNEHHTNRELVGLFNNEFGDLLTVNLKQIESLKRRKGIKTVKFDRNSLIFNDKHFDFIKKHSPNMTIKELQQKFINEFKFDISDSQIKYYRKKFGIKSKDGGRIKKGANPWNKGTKGLVKAKSTSFKKGHKPPTTLPIGSETLINGVVYVKVSEKRFGLENKNRNRAENWKAKHIVLWEEAHGKVPEDHRLIFMDKNKLNVSLENLKCLPVSDARFFIDGYYTDDPGTNELGIEINRLVKKGNEIRRLVKK